MRQMATISFYGFACNEVNNLIIYCKHFYKYLGYSLVFVASKN
jgi:hypothetical protein